MFLYGGTFDPPHFGHLYPLQSVADKLNIDSISLLPASIPALKKAVSSATHRLAMTRLLIAQDDRLKLDTTELEREGPSYTINTLQHLKSLHPRHKIVFIIGQDALANIHLWHNWRSLFDYCHLLVMTRPNTAYLETNKVASNLYKFYTHSKVLDDIVSSKMDEQSRLYLSSKLAPIDDVKQCEINNAFMDIISTSIEGNLWLVRNDTIAISSTLIRERVRCGKDISQWVPNPIIEYITQHNLYLQ